MESIIRKVDELNTDERRMYESVVGHALREDQRVTLEEADPVIDEAIHEVRRGSRRPTPADDHRQRT